MKPSILKHKLLWRLSGVLLLLLILLGVAYVSIATFSARNYYQETTQKLNSHVASEMLKEVNPFVDGKVNQEAVGKIMHSMMAVNPSLEVYLLNPQGEILKYVVLDKDVRLKNIGLGPIKEFIQEGGDSYILGDDPRNPGKKTIFSATEVRDDNGNMVGYVYMVLASAEYENISESLSASYFMKMGSRAFAVTLVAAFGIGLFLIYLLTRNLRIVIEAVRRFENGDYHARIPVEKSGELSDLSMTFNKMADTLLHNIEELKEVDALRRELIANVSHDLRSPMSVIQGYIETLIMKGDSLSEEEQRKYLEVIFHSSEKLNKLVTDLFELSKLEARQVKLNPESFNINELLQDTAQQYQLQARKKGIELNTSLNKELRVNADIALMQRAIQNLMDNALKYTPENGQISIRTTQNNSSVEVQIANSGKGIPKEKEEKIFDRYYMLNMERSKGDGSGLGLAIVKNIMDIHGINIRVGRTPDQNTLFSFSMPQAQ